MTADDIILHIFYLVGTSLPAVPRQGFASQAKPDPSELLTIGSLFGLKDGCFPTFYRWLDLLWHRPLHSIILAVSPNFCQLFSSNLNRQSREIP